MIALLTDFGLADPYVGQMKAAIFARAPGAVIIDVSHGVAPHNLIQAGFFLAASLPLLPKKAVIAAVVDPGVGSPRRIVGVTINGRTVLAPDNGLVTLALARTAKISAYDLTPKPSRAVSRTFHGRDVFAPLAAALDSGVKLAALGRRIDPGGLVRLPGLDPEISDGRARTVVVHVDRFGNCVLALPDNRATIAALPGSLTLRVPVRHPLARVRCYADLAPGQVGLLAGSQGYLELAMNQESAAARLGLKPGEVVELEGDEPRGRNLL